MSNESNAPPHWDCDHGNRRSEYPPGLVPRKNISEPPFRIGKSCEKSGSMFAVSLPESNLRNGLAPSAGRELEGGPPKTSCCKWSEI